MAKYAVTRFCSRGIILEPKSEYETNIPQTTRRYLAPPIRRRSFPCRTTEENPKANSVGPCGCHATRRQHCDQSSESYSRAFMPTWTVETRLPLSLLKQARSCAEAGMEPLVFALVVSWSDRSQIMRPIFRGENFVRRLVLSPWCHLMARRPSCRTKLLASSIEAISCWNPM